MSWVAGKRVAFTGKLASLTRSEAAELVRRHGGCFLPAVTKRTTMLVVGQEGWPLQADGRLSRKLERARRLQALGQIIAIVPEEELLQQLGLEASSAEIHQRFSLAQLCRLLKVPRDRLRAWLRQGLLQPSATLQGIPYFDFQQVTGVRTLWDLARSGVSLERLRKSLELLARWLPKLGPADQHLRLLERNGQVLCRLDEGQLAEPTGQLQLDFTEQENGPRLVAAQSAPSPEELFRQGCDLEAEGNLIEAVQTYREAIYLGGPGADLCFNLANALYALGQLQAAAERYWQAVELDHQFVDAWNNLGNVLLEVGQDDEALRAYRQALQLNKHYADAHYNLADALEQMGRPTQARPHWKDYLALEPFGEWAEYARQRLSRKSV